MQDWAAEKGQTAEQELKAFLNKHWPWPVFTNVYIPSGDHTTEADMVMVAPFGLCVFECKFYKGQIFGSGDEQEWVQFFDGKQFPLYNPIMQNNLHCAKLAEYLGLSLDDVFSIVCFMDTADISQVVYDARNENLVLCNLYDLEERMDLLVNDFEDIFDTQKQGLYSMVLAALSDSSQEARERHIAGLKGTLTELYQMKVPSGGPSGPAGALSDAGKADTLPDLPGGPEQLVQAIPDEAVGKPGQDPNIRCPFCNGALKERCQKNGHWVWGCENFPECRYTRPF